jgi:ribosomal protein L27
VFSIFFVVDRSTGDLTYFDQRHADTVITHSGSAGHDFETLPNQGSVGAVRVVSDRGLSVPAHRVGSVNEPDEDQTVSGVQLCLEDFPESVLKWLTEPEAEYARGVVVDLMGILQAQAVEPPAVTLVIAGKFTEAVQRRLGDGAAAYNTERLGGMAAAKTMPRDDGGIDIVVPAPLVLGHDDEGQDARALRTGLLLHLAEHEAQHVGMRQRGEALHDAGRKLGRGQAHANFCASAGVVLEEHRAELVAATTRPPADAYWKSVPESLDHLNGAFRDAVVLRYPSESMDRPMATALGAAHNAWIAAAYLAAHQRTSGDIAGVPPQLAAAPRWQEFMASHWQAFTSLCARVPAGNAPVDRSVLEKLILELADLFSRWFVTMGFGLRDLPDGHMYFDVHRHDF